MINKWKGIHLSSLMFLSAIDGLSDRDRMGESADAEEIEFFSGSGEDS